MALEDFDESGMEPDLGLDRIDLSAIGKIDPNDPMDEDLFEFPAMAVFDDLADTSAQVNEEPAPEPAQEAAAVAETSEPEISSDPVAGTPGSPGYDAKLDEDLFDFAAIFVGEGAPEASTSSGDNDVFVVPEAATASGSAPSSPQPPPTAAPSSSPSPSAPAADEPVAAPLGSAAEDELIALADAGHSPITVPVVAGGSRDKLVMMLAVGFLLVNTALIVLAWQANSSFHGTLRDVTTGIADGISSATNRPAQAAPSIQYVPVQTTGHTPRSPGLSPSKLDGLGEQTITSARQMIAEGRYIDARRDLNHLLANHRLLLLNAEIIAEAEFLIAETYELQGNALIEQEAR